MEFANQKHKEEIQKDMCPFSLFKHQVISRLFFFDNYYKYFDNNDLFRVYVVCLWVLPFFSFAYSPLGQSEMLFTVALGLRVMRCFLVKYANKSVTARKGMRSCGVCLFS